METRNPEALSRLKKLDPKATADQLTKALHDAVSGHPENAIRDGLKNLGFPVDQIDKAIGSILPSPGGKPPDPVDIIKKVTPKIPEKPSWPKLW